MWSAIQRAHGSNRDAGGELCARPFERLGIENPGWGGLARERTSVMCPIMHVNGS
jgi:hypothetical protein